MTPSNRPRFQHVIAMALLALIAIEGRPTMPRELFDSGIPHDESAIVGKLYADTQERLRKLVEKPLGSTKSAREFNRGRSSLLLSQVDEQIRSLKIETSQWTGKKAVRAFSNGRRVAESQAKEWGIKPEGPMQVQGSLALINTRAVQLLAADMSKAADSMGDRAKRLIRGIAQTGLSEEQLQGITKRVDSSNRAVVTASLDRRISQLVAQGIIEGTPAQTIKQLAADLSGIYGETVVIINKNGEPMEFEPRDYAERVIRTRTREVMVDAQHDRLRELDIDTVIIIGKVSDNFCTAFLGQAFSLSGQSKEYPPLDSLPDGGPPFHVKCSKGTRAFVPELASQKEIDRAEILDDSEKLLASDSKGNWSTDPRDRMSQAEAQKAFKDLQIHQQIKGRYGKAA
jgi:hypothetical protein